MKKRLGFGFLLTALGAFTLGIFLQRNHALMPLKRWFKGQPIQLAPPSRNILHWKREFYEQFQPEFSLTQLTLKELEKNRSAYIQKLEELLRLSSFPKNFDSKIQVVERVELAKVFREKIKIETEPDLWIPFYLFVPKERKGRVPYILVFHGHSAGKIETAGLHPSYQNGNALALAEAGFATVTPDFRGFGELGWEGDWQDPLGHDYGRSIHIQDVLHNLAMGRTTLGSFFYDVEKIRNYLKTRDEIDQNKIGVAGTSMGADIAIWYAILHPEIKVIVASSSSIIDLPARGVDYGQYHPCINTIPGIMQSFRRRELPLLLAPRPLFLDLHRQLEDAPRPYIRPYLKTLYQQAGSPEKLIFRFHLGGESFPNDTAVVWFKKWL